LYTTRPGLGRATDAAGPTPPAPITNTTRPSLGRAKDAAGPSPPAPITNTTRPSLGRAKDASGPTHPTHITNTTGPGLGRATDAAGRIPDSGTDGPGAGAGAGCLRVGHDRGTAYDSHRQGQDQSIAHPALPCNDELRFGQFGQRLLALDSGQSYLRFTWGRSRQVAKVTFSSIHSHGVVHVKFLIIRAIQ